MSFFSFRDFFQTTLVNRPSAPVNGKPGPAVIFIHGIAGRPAKTWGKMIKVCASDAAFNDHSLSCYSYPSGWLRPPFGKGTPKLQELARGLETELRTLHDGRKDIILVAHSLGGLVARQYILSAVKGRRPLLANKLMLYAVPNTGAALARLTKTLPLDSGAMQQLGYTSDILEILNEDWITHGVEARIPTKYVVGGADALVEPDSARPFFGHDNVSTLIGHTHRSIVDATSVNDIRYAVLRQFVIGGERVDNPPDNFLQGRSADLITGKKTADPLFDLYSAKDAEFYVRRNCDLFLKTGMSTGHVWLVGPSGVGKTAALRHCALSSGWQLSQLMLGSYQGSTALQLLHAICSEIADLTGSNEILSKDTTEAELINRLRRYFRVMPAGVVSTILIEEIPIFPGKELGLFLSLVLKLILSLEADAATAGRIQLAFSSIHEPRGGGGLDSPKITEKLQFLSFSDWTDAELIKLVDLLTPILKPELSADEKRQISVAATGSPRFVKLVFRRWRNGTANGLTVPQLLASVRAELV